MKLHDVLGSHTVDQLKGLVSIIGKGKAPTRKAPIVEFVEGHLTEVAFWKVLVAERLDDLQRDAIAHMVHDRWPAWDGARFHAIHGANPEMGDEPV